MPCEHHKEALIEAAASGVEPQGELRGHLAGCAECRATFEQERLLCASIDSGLRVTANAEVPVSLLPRVRTRLDVESAVPSRGLAGNWLVLASAAVVVAGIFVARAVWRPVIRENPSINAAEKSPSAPAPRSPREDAHNSERIAKNNPPAPQQDLAAENPSKARLASAGRSGPEVLVPKDQEVLLAEYAELWHQRKHAPLAAQDSDAAILAPLQVAQIQIAELDVKPLADEKSQ
jgi:hypothetical protein